MNNGSQDSKQTKETARKGKKILRLHEQGLTWAEAGKRVGVVKEDGSPTPGHAYKIAVEGNEPASQELRDRLGLKKMCLACMRGFRNVKSRARSLSPWRLWWRRLSPAERDRRIREDYEEENQ